jgi:hypothetical protein
MSHSEIIEMARKAGFVLYDMHDVDGEDLGETAEVDDWKAFERFAAMVRTEALEEAVRLLQSRDMGDCTREDAEALRCALAVRDLIRKNNEAL